MTATLLPGHLLGGKYQVVRPIGRGGMGAVYEVRNHLGRRFAVKLLLDPQLTEDSEAAERLLEEARAASAIESDHVLEVFDSGVDPNTRLPFIIMELLQGQDLEHLLERAGPLRPIAAARLISQAARGLARAHQAGIVHRDIKPANLFLSERDALVVVKLLDFGIAKRLEPDPSHASWTVSGAMIGTPRYMSPEQAKGLRTVDARSDLWSLGMCLYEALSGQLPFGAEHETPGQLILAICTEDLVRLETLAPWVPVELAEVVHHCLTRDVSERMPSATALMQRLHPFCEGTLTLDDAMLSGFVLPSGHLHGALPRTLERMPTPAEPLVGDGPGAAESPWVPVAPTQPSGSPPPPPPPPPLALALRPFGVHPLDRARDRHGGPQSSKWHGVLPWALLTGVAALGGAGGAVASRAFDPSFTSGAPRVVPAIRVHTPASIWPVHGNATEPAATSTPVAPKAVDDRPASNDPDPPREPGPASAPVPSRAPVRDALAAKPSSRSLGPAAKASTSHAPPPPEAAAAATQPSAPLASAPATAEPPATGSRRKINIQTTFE